MSFQQFLIVGVFLFAVPTVWAQGTSHAPDFQGLCAPLALVPDAKLAEAMGGYREAMERREGLAASDLRAVSFQDLQNLMQRAVDQGWGVLDVFTQPVFSKSGPCALFMDEATLKDINRHFDLHGVWQIAARPLGEATPNLPMRYLIVGRGVLLVGYPRGATVVIADGDAVSGEYEYAPYLSARIETVPERQGVLDIRTLAGPEAEFGPFVGPYGARIQSMRLVNGEIIVTYTWGMEQERRARNVPISARGHLAKAPVGLSSRR